MVKALRNIESYTKQPPTINVPPPTVIFSPAQPIDAARGKVASIIRDLKAFRDKRLQSERDSNGSRQSRTKRGKYFWNGFLLPSRHYLTIFHKAYPVRGAKLEQMATSPIGAGTDMLDPVIRLLESVSTFAVIECNGLDG